LLREELGSCGGNFGGKGKPQQQKWWETIPHVKKNGGNNSVAKLD
jgi:hypothetical protein